MAIPTSIFQASVRFSALKNVFIFHVNKELPLKGVLLFPLKGQITEDCIMQELPSRKSKWA